ncbi:hypothetical protein JXQ70_11505 [bacterium]|nr:hypothetical protein [bacterium]
MKKRLFLMLLVLPCIILAMSLFMFTGCDDDDDDDPTPTPTATYTPTPTPTPTPPEVFFFDNFDSYTTGSTLAGQGGWQTWDGSAAYDATVVDEQAHSTPNSLAVREASDMVHTFSGVTSGVWYAKVWTYVPTGQTGELLFILLNEFIGVEDPNWSTQIRICATEGVVESIGGTGFESTATTPAILDQWVEIRVEIDLDNNLQKIYYNDVMFDQTVWQATGSNKVEAMDLFSNKSSNSYMDDVYLDINP